MNRLIVLVFLGAAGVIIGGMLAFLTVRLLDPPHARIDPVLLEAHRSVSQL